MKTITADNLISSYDKRHKPCAEVELDETFVMETHDRTPLIASTETLADSFKDRFNPIYSVTGPVFINGTRPGDMLGIEILTLL